MKTDRVHRSFMTPILKDTVATLDIPNPRSMICKVRTFQTLAVIKIITKDLINSFMNFHIFNHFDHINTGCLPKQCKRNFEKIPKSLFICRVYTDLRKREEEKYKESRKI